MRSSILFGLLATAALTLCGQDAQASCHYRHHHYGRVRSCYTPRYYAPTCGISSCNSTYYAPTFASTCYSTPAVSCSAPSISTAFVPASPIVTCTANSCVKSSVPQFTQVYYSNR